MQISLKAARVNAGFSQHEVCRKIKKSTQTLVNWENGKTSIDMANLALLCSLYHIDEKYIFLPH